MTKFRSDDEVQLGVKYMGWAVFDLPEDPEKQEKELEKQKEAALQAFRAKHPGEEPDIFRCDTSAANRELWLVGPIEGGFDVG